MELNERGCRMRERLVGLEAAEPPEPWGNRIVIDAERVFRPFRAGILAGTDVLWSG
jgi:hypothetical protein